MPEGDTIYRTAETLRRWLGGREISAARSRVYGFPALRLVGLTVEGVEARGKHLLVRFDSGQVLHTHLRMSGSWHVYPSDRPWRRPESQARLVLECGDRVAVCFNAPIVELLQPKAEGAHPSLGRLGPDVLADDLDLAEVRRRARTRPPDLALGELLLDQQVVAGIGNIWRSEALFVAGRSPWTERRELSDGDLDAVVTTASSLMKASAVARGRGAPHWVYKRGGQPCRRCGTPIASRRQGEQARTAYWCPGCQPG
ncbi:MAG: Fpg/Nei family DNA glycosylase [Acidimicrobiia bacterium]|nr:Fpg/Nei family DNA glycosylase [Acidimicrobiia bacterium]